VDRQGLSAPELARLKRRGRSRQVSAFQAALSQWRPSRSLGDRLADAALALTGDLNRARRNLAELLDGDFLFAFCLWVAVFVIAATTASTAQVPLHLRYAVGLTALAYLYLYAELSRIRPIPGRETVLAVADGAVAAVIYLLSAPYVGYAEMLLFFASARMVARFKDLRALPAGLLLLLPVLVRKPQPPIALVLEAFGLLTLMLTVEHLLELVARARRDAGRQASLAMLSSAVARALDADALFGQLVTLAPALLPGRAWGFWLREESSGDYRPERWYGLPSGERPVAAFTPGLAPERSDAVVIVGPMPGTSSGSRTLIQPMVCEGEVVGLVTVSGGDEVEDPALARLLSPVAEEAALALTRLQAFGDDRRRIEAMEMANRLAGIAAAAGRDLESVLNAVSPALGEALRCESVHLEWLEGDDVRLVVPARDPLFLGAPPRLPLPRTRSAEALSGRGLREPVAGRRPEDVVLASAGIRHVAVVPISSGRRRGTLQVGRREPRAFTAAEVLLLQLVAERLRSWSRRCDRWPGLRSAWRAGR
jgi:hypothetical protein